MVWTLLPGVGILNNFKVFRLSRLHVHMLDEEKEFGLTVQPVSLVSSASSMLEEAVRSMHVHGALACCVIYCFSWFSGSPGVSGVAGKSTENQVSLITSPQNRHKRLNGRSQYDLAAALFWVLEWGSFGGYSCLRSIISGYFQIAESMARNWNESETKFVRI
jgi:hypothetical protein